MDITWRYLRKDTLDDGDNSIATHKFSMYLVKCKKYATTQTFICRYITSNEIIDTRHSAYRVVYQYYYMFLYHFLIPFTRWDAWQQFEEPLLYPRGIVFLNVYQIFSIAPSENGETKTYSMAL